MNRIMTWGQDLRWRREVIQRAALPPGGRLLDLGTGTGDLARESLRQYPASQAVAADFTPEMMQVGQGYPNGEIIHWCLADALALPFRPDSFDAVVSGFFMRNVADLNRSIAEQMRVLKPGGRLVALDTTRPRPGLLYPFIQLYLRYGVPTLGSLISGLGNDYRYLTESTESFVSAEQMAARLAAAGLQPVGYRLLMFGTVAIHWGEKP